MTSALITVFIYRKDYSLEDAGYLFFFSPLRGKGEMGLKNSMKNLGEMALETLFQMKYFAHINIVKFRWSLRGWAIVRILRALSRCL